ncbi:MAG: hypothetical protein K2Q14_04805 [Gammaproteobacteria bacterium]|nr:hypothetical protein [Gammaproteobacteria bacterium]MBY0544852.1 hypothetical protein [Gammaproteobacteria bacterium]
MKKKDNDPILYTQKELAKKLDLTERWFRRNRQSRDAITAVRLGHRKVRYPEPNVYKWLGRSDLELEFYSIKKLAKILGCSEDWIHTNQLGENPIPSWRFGRLKRFNKTQLYEWLKSNSIGNNKHLMEEEHESET